MFNASLKKIEPLLSGMHAANVTGETRSNDAHASTTDANARL